MNAPVVDLHALARTGPVHFMGAGGAGMCALAELILRRGGQASGCDARDSRPLSDLVGLGATVDIGHHPDHVSRAVALVITSAVGGDHAEVRAARERGIPVLKRAQALGSLVNNGTVVAVAGTHGKTTTTALTTTILVEAGFDPTGFVGGRVPAWEGNLRLGGSDISVVEADEYDRSFHQLTPDVAIVTNLEADHLDIYGSLDGVKEGFRIFLDGVRDGGRVVVCADDTGASRLLPSVGDRGYSYGLSAGSMLRAVDVSADPTGTTCRIFEEGQDRGQLTLPLGGVHNLRNALAGAAAARHLGADWDAIKRGTASFSGVGRRFERLGEAGGVLIVDDYAHHPTEIASTLSAATATFSDRRLVVAFQPHLFSRTRDFSREFGASLIAADVIVVTDVFPAREAPIEGVTGEIVVDAARSAGADDVRYVPDVTDLAEALSNILRPGDVLFTLGAGSIESVGAAVLSRLERSADA